MPSNHSFLSGSCVAVYGVSPNRRTIAATVGDALRAAGWKVYVIHPDGGPDYYTDLESLPEKTEAVYIATNPKAASTIVDQAIAAGVKRVWLQFGAYNKELIQKCKDAGLAVHAGCLMMYIPNAGFMHSLHRVIHELVKGKP
jgi:predicted CoA-binding protein